MSILTKIIVIIPVMVVSLFYLRIIYHEQYSEATPKRVLGFILSVLLLYAWIFFIIIKKRQDDHLQIIVQSAFFVYVFALLQLTGYFILFKEISSVDWWGKMNHRIDTHDHVNFQVFETMNRYSPFNKQMIGNAIMLLPLGIFLPLMNRKLRKLTAFFLSY